MIYLPQAELELRLEEIRSVRFQLMDEVCEVIADIPPAEIERLFGAASSYLQNKLSKRYV